MMFKDSSRPWNAHFLVGNYMTPNSKSHSIHVCYICWHLARSGRFLAGKWLGKYTRPMDDMGIFVPSIGLKVGSTTWIDWGPHFYTPEVENSSAADKWLSQKDPPKESTVPTTIFEELTMWIFGGVYWVRFFFCSFANRKPTKSKLWASLF